MSKGNPKFSPTFVFAFATAFLATDYFLYKMQINNVNSLVWARVLDDIAGSASQPIGRQ
jgi:hypothetical protein